MGLMFYSEKSFTKIVPTMLSNNRGLGGPLISLLCVVILHISLIALVVEILHHF